MARHAPPPRTRGIGAVAAVDALVLVGGVVALLGQHAAPHVTVTPPAATTTELPELPTVSAEPLSSPTAVQETAGGSQGHPTGTARRSQRHSEASRATAARTTAPVPMPTRATAAPTPARTTPAATTPAPPTTTAAGTTAATTTADPLPTLPITVPSTTSSEETP
jgi:hypothetical protein